MKRRIYGLSIMGACREYRSSQLAGVSVETDYGFQFAGNPTYLQQTWEPNERQIVSVLLPTIDVFIDVGANQGFYSCLAAHAGKDVAAVEPESSNLKFLKSNVARNGFNNVEIYPLAMSDKPGVLQLYGDGDTASLVSGWLGTSSAFCQAVPTNSLDNLFADRWAGKRLFIKIDVEGFEEAVISGANALIAREPTPIWLIETFPEMLDGSGRQNPGFMSTFKTLLSSGYRAVLVDKAQMPVSFDVVKTWYADPSTRGLGGSNFLLFQDRSSHT